MIKTNGYWSTVKEFLVYKLSEVTHWFNQQAECELCFAPAGPAGFLCPACFADLPMARAACSQCAEPLSQPGRCQHCLQQPPAFDYAFAAYLYRAPVSLWLQQYKDQHQLRWLPRLSWLMRQQMPAQDIIHRIDAIAFVPSARGKLLRRGFNPAGLLARHMASAMHKPLLSNALQRHYQPGTTEQDQRGLNRRQRRQNQQRSLQAGQLPLQGQHILLIEDVITTGATADAAARALKQQGAAIVGLWALARTPPKGS